jgi:hypothetical protein
MSRAYFLLLQEAVPSDKQSEEAEFNALLRQAVAGGEERYRSYLEAGQRSGQLQSEFDPRSEALLVHSVLRGISLRWLVNPGAVDLDRFTDDYLSRLADTLLANPFRRGELGGG